MSESNDLFFNEVCKLVKKESKSWSQSLQKELLMNLAFTSAFITQKAKNINQPVSKKLLNDCEKTKKFFYGISDSSEEED